MSKLKNQSRIEKSYFNSVFASDPYLFGGACILSMVSRGLSFVFVFFTPLLLDSFGDYQKATHVIVMMALTGLSLGVIGFLQTLCDLGLSHKLLVNVQTALQESGGKDVVSLRRLFGRDFNTYLESTSSVVSMVTVPVTLLAVSLFIFYSYGVLGVLCLASVSAFVPLSGLLAALANKVFDQVMQVSAQRLELCEKWLSFGPLLRNWGFNRRLGEIRNLLEVEIKLRGYDSLIRSSDSYITNFGRVVPFLLAGSIVLLFDYSISDLPLLFWLSIPLLGIVLEFPQVFVSFKNASRSAAQLSASFGKEDRFSESQDVELNDSWKIWRGTVRENLIFLCDQTNVILESLNLALRASFF